MACSFPVVGYQNPGPHGAQCCSTARAISTWIVQRGPRYYQSCGCAGYKLIQGTTTPSVHGTGRAIDTCIIQQPNNNPSYSGLQNIMILTIDTYLTPQACNLGIQRMIFKRKVWNSNQAPLPWASWSPFTGQQNHDDHLHLEITPAKCNTFTIADINFIFGVIANPLIIFGGNPGEPISIDPVPVGSGTTGSSTGSGGGTGGTGAGTGGGGGGGDVPPTPAPTDTQPVWSAVNPIYSPCTACGGQFAGLNSDPQDGDVTALQYTYCGGTGAICIEISTGVTCSTGAAPPLGNFPGPIKDFLWWGDGAYALSADGMTIYAAGGFPALTPPVFVGGVGPWDNLYQINPTTIGVSAPGTVGFKSATATVPSIATFTCCQ